MGAFVHMFAIALKRLEQIHLACFVYRFDAAVNIQLGIDVLSMGFEGIGRKEQFFSHIRRCQTSCQQPQDFQFTLA